jgi:hypothetical protein
MKWPLRPLILSAAIAAVAACESNAPAPSVVPRPAVAAVPTSQPLRWDTREELDAWVTNAVTSAGATVIGSGTDAAIAVDMTRTTHRLHGPDLDPPPGGIRAARIRYRWLDRGTDERISVQMLLRPPVVNQQHDIVRVFFVRPDASQPPAENSGNWVEQELAYYSASGPPPFTVKFAVVAVDGDGFYSPRPVHGTIEIDWIGLIR